MRVIHFIVNEAQWIYVPEFDIAFSENCGVMNKPNKESIPHGTEISIHKGKIKKIKKYIDFIVANGDIDDTITDVFKGVQGDTKCQN